MIVKKTYYTIQFIFLIVFISGVAILSNGPDFLLAPILKNVKFPIGNAVTWILLMLFPAFFFHWFRRGNRNGKLPLLLTKIALMFGFSWGITSYVLSGNWQFSFADSTNFILWLVYTALIIFLPLISLVIRIISKIGKS